MSNFLFINDEEARGKISIDDLYERNMQRDLRQLSIFNKVLNRVHRRITLTARNKRNDKYIWFHLPDYIFGEPTYDSADCVAFVVNKLSENGFHVRYIHPNTIFVSWENWVPAYVRSEIRKKTGKTIDEKGRVVTPSSGGAGGQEPPSDEALMNGQGIFAGTVQPPPKRTYTPISAFVPSHKKQQEQQQEQEKMPHYSQDPNQTSGADPRSRLVYRPDNLYY